MDEATLRVILEEISGMRVAVCMLADILHEKGIATRSDIAARMRLAADANEQTTVRESLKATAELIETIDGATNDN
jgi:hypothetical protein